MPVKTKTKRAFKGKSTRKYYSRKKNALASSVPRNNVKLGLGLPKKMTIKQKYQETFTLTTASGNVKNHVFNLNGLYDPNQTGLGHQPYYFDQMIALYNHYTVIGCRMTVTYVPYESNTVPVSICLWQNDDATVVPTSMDTFGETSKSKVYILGDGGSDSKTLSLNWSARKTFGPPLANDLLRGSSSANPSEVSCGVVSIQPVDALTDVNVSVQVKMEFITVYTELKDIAGS